MCCFYWITRMLFEVWWHEPDNPGWFALVLFISFLIIILGIIFALVDLLISPFEIIAFIIWKIYKKNKEKRRRKKI